MTNASHGSDDTVTQESYKRSSSSPVKHRRSSKHKKSKEKMPMPIPQRKPSPRPEKMKQERTTPKSSVDVFEFLVEDEGQDASTPRLGEKSEAAVEPYELPPAEESDDEGYVRSHHSDSGISMGSNSICLTNGESVLDDRLPPLPEESQDNTDHQGQLIDRSTYPRRLRLKWPEVPRATHKQQNIGPGTRTPSPEQRRSSLASIPEPSEQDFLLPKEMPLSGYDLVADKLAQGHIPPVFRRFKRINYRVLLQLQDEIIEMEDQLANLDMADTRSRLNSDGSTSPASRRLNWQWNHSELHAHRLEVLGRLYIKIEQYYQALLSAQQVQKQCRTAIPTDIEQFRSWLRKNKPLSGPESRFLDDDNDLMMLLEDDRSNGRAATARSSTMMAPADLVPLCILTTTLFPLLCFKLTTGVLNRMIILVAVLAAGLGSLEKLDRSRVPEHKQLIVACFGVSFLVALLF
ncbi:uncharacterized protein A1O9_00625 [Exophiala aquamarina CBS 119918]|uniref:DUF6594 domain-containing protein n=1 Tax=Exophiala aquamarina CBS 119918 TaxID=1182545 RepID=A0A072PSB1_9EURO|nr:uncharacterized protein A1O9_00625 [Exophiala aquamarina CBS 119918]KEF62652.1 hypothetical protein A1O9_00625 [Exophiala aquamarina CBS 119918]